MRRKIPSPLPLAHKDIYIEKKGPRPPHFVLKRIKQDSHHIFENNQARKTPFQAWKFQGRNIFRAAIKMKKETLLALFSKRTDPPSDKLNIQDITIGVPSKE